MVGNSVAANLIMLICLIGGIISAFAIKKEVFPDTEIDVVTVTVSYPGAGPEEIENAVVLPVEEKIADLNGIKKVTSTSFEGVGRISVELLENQNNYRIYQDILTAVNRISTFPESAEKPQVTLSYPMRGVVSLVIYGDYEKKVIYNAAEGLRDALLADSRITQVELTGSNSPEIAIEISQDTLRRYGISLAEVAAKIAATSVEIPSGTIKTEKGDILIRLTQRGEVGQDFEKMIVLTGPDGTNVTLGDIATVKDDFEETDRISLYNGKNAISVDVYRVGEQTPVSVAEASRRIIREYEKTLPPGLKIDVRRDQSKVYVDRMNLLLNNAYMGMALVFIFLGLFLELRLAFWVTLGIPTSFLGAFLFLPSLGVSINMTSLFAFIIALGIVVDDAIVIGEMIHDKRQSGLSPVRASIEGARAVAMPVCFSVMTNIVTFVPLLFVPGMMGRMFGDIPVVVITVFAISLFEALFVLPNHLSHAEPHRGRIEQWLFERQQAFGSWFMQMVSKIYKPFLEATIRHRYITLSLAFSMLLITAAYIASGRIGFVMMPTIESHFASVSIEMPYESPFSSAERIAKQLIDAAYRVDEKYKAEDLIVGIYSNIGPGSNSTGANEIDVRVYLLDSEERKLSTAAFARMWREEAGTLTGVEKVAFESDRGGPGHGYSIQLELAHKDADLVEQISSELAEMVRDISWVTDIDDGSAVGKVQYSFTVTPLGESLGLTAREIGRQVRGNFSGAEVLRQVRGRNEIKVMARLPKEERVSEHDVEKLILKAPDGSEVPLNAAAKVSYGRSYTTLNHVDGKRVAIFSANVEPNEKTQLVRQKIVGELLPKLRSKYPGLSWSFGGHQREINDSMGALSRYFIIAALVIFALLAVPLKSYSQPLIIMTSIPFGIIGAVGGHMLLGQPLSINSVMGIIALSGVVVNDSLVLIEYANSLIKQGLSYSEAVIRSGVRRFRPIFLTTITTFGGLAPMIFEKSRQAQFMIPMAVSLGFGLLFSTLITLVIVPSLYVSVNSLLRRKHD